MAKFTLHSFELSDIKKVVEEVLSKKLNEFKTPEKKSLKLLTRKETAKILCVSLPTLHDWTKTGIVIAHRIGNRVLYKPDEISDALNQITTSKIERRNHVK